MGFRKDLLERAKRMATKDTDVFPIFLQLLLACHRRNQLTLTGDVSPTGLPTAAEQIRKNRAAYA